MQRKKEQSLSSEYKQNRLFSGTKGLCFMHSLENPMVGKTYVTPF